MSEPCTWHLPHDELTWETACGKAFDFIDGTPSENEFKFCPFCGNPVTESQDAEDAQYD